MNHQDNSVRANAQKIKEKIKKHGISCAHCKFSKLDIAEQGYVQNTLNKYAYTPDLDSNMVPIISSVCLICSSCGYMMNFATGTFLEMSAVVNEAEVRNLA
jgi:hypothetical protein